MAQREYTPLGERILAVADTRDGGNAQSRLVGYILQSHRAKRTLVSILKEPVLPMDYCRHSHRQCAVAHLHGIDKPLGRFHLGLGIQQCITLTTAYILLRLVGLEDIRKRARYAQVGHLSIIQREGDCTVILCIHNEVGSYLLHTAPYGIVHRRSRFGIQSPQFHIHLVGLVLGHLQ